MSFATFPPFYLWPVHDLYVTVCGSSNQQCHCSSDDKLFFHEQRLVWGSSSFGKNFWHDTCSALSLILNLRFHRSSTSILARCPLKSSHSCETELWTAPLFTVRRLSGPRSLDCICDASQGERGRERWRKRKRSENNPNFSCGGGWSGIIYLCTAWCK